VLEHRPGALSTLVRGRTMPNVTDLPALLADMPGVVEGLLAAHVPDDRGRCAGCSGQRATGAPVWPCTLRNVAERASRIRLGRAL